MFPWEIYENILKFADGSTLLQARSVCTQWNDIVNYLDKKENIWRKCCNEEIPAVDLHALINKYWSSGDKDWRIVYHNWILWKQLGSRTHWIVEIPYAAYYSTCAKISGNIIVIGNICGTLRFMREDDGFLYSCHSYYHTQVKDILFLNEKPGNVTDGFKHTHILVEYELKLVLYEITDYTVEEVLNIGDVTTYGLFNNYLCYEDDHGRIVVREIIFNFNSPAGINLVPITEFFVYRPTKVNALSIYDGKVVIITDCNVLSFDYSSGIPIATATIGQRLPISYITVEKYWIFYNEVLFAIGINYFHVIRISEDVNKVVEKRFRYEDILNTNISDIYLHGHMLIIATINGYLYFYSVKDWADFNLEKYDCKMCCHSDAITSIDVQELDAEQRILLMTKSCLIHAFLY